MRGQCSWALGHSRADRQGPCTCVKTFSSGDPALKMPSTATSFALKAETCTGMTAGVNDCLRQSAAHTPTHSKADLVLRFQHGVRRACLLAQVLHDAVRISGTLVLLRRLQVAPEDLHHSWV